MPNTNKKDDELDDFNLKQDDTPDNDSKRQKPDTNGVFKFTDDSNAILNLKNSNTGSIPKFDGDSKEYITNFMATTEKGSLVLGIPGSVGVKNDDFIENDIKRVISTYIKKNEKTIVLLYGVPNIFTKTIKVFDVQNPTEDFLNLLVTKTKRSEDEVLSAIYCLSVLQHKSNDILKKIGTNNVISLLQNYGINPYDKKNIYNFVFPEAVGNSGNPISYIITFYDLLLQKRLLKCILACELKGYKALVLCNLDVAFKLKPLVKNIETIYKKHKENVKVKKEKMINNTKDDTAKTDTAKTDTAKNDKNNNSVNNNKSVKTNTNKSSKESNNAKNIKSKNMEK